MGMINPDLQNKIKVETQEKIKNALETGDTKALTEAITAMAQDVESNILDQANKQIENTIQDRNVLGARGTNVLTAKETKFYNEAISNGGFDGMDNILPVTIINRVFDDLQAEHPLLSKIDFVNVTGITEFITRTSDCEGATWGDLTEEIKKKLTNGFKKEDVKQLKLSAYLPVSKSMLDLGPEWLDKFVRAMLGESLAIGLELGIVAGTGNKEPIGMIKSLSKPVTQGVYADKDASKLTDFKPDTLGKQVMAPLTNEGKKTITGAIMVVNPMDYWSKIFGLTTFLTQNGTYVYGVMPIPVDIVQSVAMPVGKMAVGRAKDYFMGVGSSQKIEYSDHYQFLDDVRTYLCKQYGEGKPKDDKSFLVFDISGLGLPQA
ncbi:major capsid protein [Clostridium botulinum]|uniref:phage major capsid protein n=1 Tax=Clostridium botulinum TaxID=1491 RepID=UPI0006A7475D|nr:phage major capsid protein [Clostridium botulinum]KOM97079.1 major capsid protein [Clostridium botulinum]KOM99496.1 major capsid protein [Clostridium botulinum]MBY7004550.1 phage major capsid protein [Clostridium botulinum]MCR1147215.1 phage major capsid protein [Clostridium botulinum]NFH94514.1 phage major capsid protein [Clostridium botulinum]